MTSLKDNMNENPENKLAITNDTGPEGMYLSQKCKRLAGALYAVTQFFADEEPLKTRIRDAALSLVESVHSPRSQLNSETGTLHTLYRLRDQITVARDGGMLSHMNHQVLLEEMDKLTQKLQEQSGSLGPHVNNKYLSVDQDALPSKGRNKQSSDSSNSTDADDNESARSEPLSAKDRRRQKILDLFDEANEITVNDVTEVINGYSTKTIQRDLKALVESGKLEKHGKRRWTSYTRA